jgi:methylated-DNA-[protein]-cysteine S-methyltransferase
MTDRNAGFDAVIELPVAVVGIRLTGEAVSEVAFLPSGTPVRRATDAVARRACEQIHAYVVNPTSSFELELVIRGSEFQQRVWTAIRAIPIGATRTYGALAAEVGSTPRAVGQACGDNRLPIVIPCHRVVAARGLGGFAHRTDAATLRVKHWLLNHESRATFALS